ncbi:MAG: cupin domain-containing protein [Solobacterium sp.]|nr:cupin domain-containing protein [Solobacterium sp.]
MIRRSSEKTTITKPAPFDGDGEITVRNLLNGPEEMEQKGRVFCHTTVHPGSEIGLHTHKGDAETYYILSGHGTYNDNGRITDVQPGDVYYCGEGQCHSIKAIDEPIEMIALILYTTK